MFLVKSAGTPDPHVKVGIIKIRELSEFGDKNLMPLIDRLSAIGCSTEHIVLRSVAKLYDVIMMIQYFAQYTDVDSVLILAPEQRVTATPALIDGIIRLQCQWNMYVAMGGAERADDIQEMYSSFIEMEQSAPDQDFDPNIS